MTAPASRARPVALAAAVCGTALTLDLASKAWAWQHLRHGGSRELVAGWVRLQFAFNTGSAFGLARDVGSARVVFIVVTVAVLLYLGRMLARLPADAGISFAAAGLFAGGALGNLHDRFVRHMWIFDRGDSYGVVDFIVLSWGDRDWPAFNLADVALALGVGLLLIGLRGRMRAETP